MSGIESISEWLESQLSIALGFPSKDIVDYIMSEMSDFDEREAYLTEVLLGGGESSSDNNPKLRGIIEEFRIKSIAQLGFRKTATTTTPTTTTTNNPEPSSKNVKKKGKPKFVPLYAKDGSMKPDTIVLKGRHPCECQASKHNLINNCMECGKIVCSQEGSGPCFFCGNLVCTSEELEVINRGSKKSEQLLKKLLNKDENQLKAERHKDTLLEYDRNGEKRTKVIDDESDYFSVDANQWLSKKERDVLRAREESLREKRHGSRLDRKMTFDFAGRKVVEAEDSEILSYDPIQDDVVKSIYESKAQEQEEDLLVNPTINRPRPVFRHSDDDDNKRRVDLSGYRELKRVQDRQLQEMSDNGFCLTMHQPWASYLVAGIKVHEGRTWYSSHRGRLWIHAAAKVPTPQEIKEVQALYGKERNFPRNLPTSCLLGFVDVVDVLPQEEYRERFPEGESSSPFVFICTNPKELVLKLPMSGKHKIYKLDPHMHKIVLKAAKVEFKH